LTFQINVKGKKRDKSCIISCVGGTTWTFIWLRVISND